jgi:hypothetical protein
MTNWTTIEIMDIIIGIGTVNPDRSVTEIIKVNLPDESNMTEDEQNEWTIANNNRMQAICNFLMINDL